ncbi:MAG TPA: TRAP transporter TatT component family protein [Verrucomicrobiae bacterium]|nr:TRAP transporter TatT component family protein [Verrucomicrobiae bacterium]
MASRRLWLLAGAWVVAFCGCRSIDKVEVRPEQEQRLTEAEAQTARQQAESLFNQQPRSLASVTRASDLFESAARGLPDDYVAQWQAAEALEFLAGNEPRSDSRKQFARRGIVFARRARELKPDGVEGHYWYALDVGRLADADRTYGLDAVGEMQTALKRAIELDERYDYAGPLRAMGVLYLRTPQPPASIGSPRKGLQILRRAVELFPDYPENYLYLAEALRDTKKVDEAKEALGKVLDANPWPDEQFESGQWKADALKLRAQLDKL